MGSLSMIKGGLLSFGEKTGLQCAEVSSPLPKAWPALEFAGSCWQSSVNCCLKGSVSGACFEEAALAILGEESMSDQRIYGSRDESAAPPIVHAPVSLFRLRDRDKKVRFKQARNLSGGQSYGFGFVHDKKDKNNDNDFSEIYSTNLTSVGYVSYAGGKRLKPRVHSRMQPGQSVAFFTPIEFPMGAARHKYNTRKGNSATRLCTRFQRSRPPISFETGMSGFLEVSHRSTLMANHAQGTPVPAIFSFESHQVRTVMRNGEPWFVAVDVCNALDIGNPTMALRRLDGDEQALSSIEGASRSNKINVISESGLYALILRSRKPVARQFAKWVTAEVLPAIRRRGAYVTPQAVQSIPSVSVPLYSCAQLREVCLAVDALKDWWRQNESHISGLNPAMGEHLSHVIEVAHWNAQKAGIWIGHVSQGEKKKP